MLFAIVKACKTIIHHIKETIENFTKPETAVPGAGDVSDITRSCKDLVEENQEPKSTAETWSDWIADQQYPANTSGKRFIKVNNSSRP